MKKIFILLNVICAVTTASPIVIELGEEYSLRGATKNIWIENAKVLTAEPRGQAVVLKAKMLGATLLRQNDKSLKAVVVPVNSKKTFQDWQKLSQSFLGLRVDFCEVVVCLKGTLYRFQDFLKILSLIESYNSIIYLSLDLDVKLKEKINLHVENHLRNNGLTPLKLIYANPWRLNYSDKELAMDYKSALKSLGIAAMLNKQKIEIADNVRVEIQITEVKKDFGQTIGLKWPSQYQAQILDNNPTLSNNEGTVLNALENQGQIKILAKPNLVCRSGKEAEFFAGGEFPIKVLNFKFQDIIWKKYGIIMKLKPTVDSSGQISLQIESEVSSIDPSRTIDGIPGLHTHRVSSHFDFIKSKTIALSGLIKNEASQSSEGLPFLSRLPVLGALFSSKQFKENKSELVIFVTPQLMKND